MVECRVNGRGYEPGLYGLALISVLWAHDGFADLSFASGEVMDPQRNLPRAIVFGTIAIIAIYVSATGLSLHESDRTGADLPVDRGRHHGIDVRTRRRLLHFGGGDDLDVRIADGQHARLATHLLCDGRRSVVLQADRSAYPRFKTPFIAILFACILGIAMVMTQTFEQLTDTFVLAMWPFYGLSVAAIYRLRKSQPQLQRPHKVIGYPVVPAIFVAAAIYLVVNALISDPKWTSITFAVVLAGLPCTTRYSGTHGRSEDRPLQRSEHSRLQPSTTIVVPLIQLARGDARKATTSPTSSACQSGRMATRVARTGDARRISLLTRMPGAPWEQDGSGSN